MAPRSAVALDAEALDPEVGAPALQGAGAALDAPHARRSRDQGDLGVAHGRVAARGGPVCGDRRRFEDGLAVRDPDW